jgi:4-amino-4-deoxy-L-arabinose transferase-like glycosyltransferase
MRWTPERQASLALMGLCALLYLPYAGHYGLWDPWETHYGEIARQMAERNDWVSLWWPGSPQDRAEVFHKPVLHFWLMALSLKLFGLEGAGAPASQFALGWRGEWALRLPNLLLSAGTVLSVWHLVRRLAGVRAGVLVALVLATSAQWVLVTRQAMTDPPFVAPMTFALVLAALALLLPREEMERELPRRRFALGRLRGSYPHARAFYLFLALIATTVLPPLIVIAIQLKLVVRLSSSQLRFAGIVPMLPYIAALIAALVWSLRCRNLRQLYLCAAWVLVGIATLAKGPAGLGLPAIVIALYLTLAGRWRDIFTRLELGRGTLLFVATAFPWYHAMLIRHGQAFWNELIGDNYIHRALGRNGDRGAFDYYLTWAAYGMFPWSGVAAVGATRALRSFRAPEGEPGGESDPRERLYAFALTWFVVDYVILTLVNTKFHHYILPALPALAICAGLLLDELWQALATGVSRSRALAIVLVAVPITLLCGRDLAAFPARLLWMFNYDYVNAPGTGRAWPSPAEYGDRYEYGAVLLVFAIAAAIFTLLLASRRPARAALVALSALAIAWSIFLADRFLIALSPHWSQKGPIATYYSQRRDETEPLLVYQLYWRGENLYTRNRIFSSPDPRERTVFLQNAGGDRQLGEYLASHPHRRLFFLFERVHLATLRNLLPPATRATFTVVDESNNKLYLATADN